MPITDKNCSFDFTEKDPAQNDKYVPKKGTGVIITEPYLKKTDKGEYMMVVVQDSSNGKLREVFVNGIDVK